MATRDDRPTYDELEEVMERAGVPPEKRQKVVKAAVLSRDRYERFLHQYKLKGLDERDRDWPLPLPDYPGEITVGFDPDGRPVGLTRRQLNEHMLVVGRSGAGKTTFFYNIMDALNDRSIPFLAVDFKNDYRTAAADLDLTVINWLDLKFNPLQPPPGVSTEKWGEIVAEIFAHATDLLVGGGLRHAVLFDEAKRVFDVNREQQPESGFPPIDDLMGKIRAFGEALIVADHEPSKLTDSVKANTNAKLWLSLGSGHDIEEMVETFGLDEENVDYTYTLDRGEAVLATAANDPVPVRLPLSSVDGAASMDDVRARTEEMLEELSYAERVRPDLFESVVRDVETDDAERLEGDGMETAVGEVAEVLLASVEEDPFLSVSARYDEINVGAKQELVTLGLVEEVVVDTKKPGRNPTLLELTDDGVAVLEECGHVVAETGRRSIVHRYWQRQVADHYASEGYDVKEEREVDGGWIDVYARMGNTAVAVEIALSPEHEVANVEKCLDAGVELVEVVTVDDAVQERVREHVAEAFDGVPDTVAFIDAGECS